MRSSNLGTPLSTKFYLNKAQGESYGMQPTPKFFKQQVATPRYSIRVRARVDLRGRALNFCPRNLFPQYTAKFAWALDCSLTPISF
jgi:hypothetical protein